MEEKVYEVFEKLNIKFDVVKHAAAFTCRDIEEDEIKFDGDVCKNLFLRNKDKSKYYLVSVPLNKKVDLKLLEKQLGETKFSFGSEEKLQEKLNI
jgi:Ala-tRNA(Pro) deacylase